MITKKLRHLLPFLALAVFGSCSWDKDMDLPGYGKGNEVVFSMRVPANYNITRSLAVADEDEVRTLDVLVFDNSNGKLLSRSTNSGSPTINGNNLDFYVRLEKDDAVSNYDFILLANSRDIITSQLYSGGELEKGLLKSEVQKKLKAELKPLKGWIADTNDPDYKAIPMWGEINNQPIEAGKTYGRADMTRAMLKIDIDVDLENGSDFKLHEVRYYNFHTEGYVVPLESNLKDGKAEKPTIDGLILNKTDYIDYTSSINTTDNELLSSIYVFEGPLGSIDDDKYMDNPCLLVKGDFNGTLGWYRLDFAGVDEATHKSNYLPLLRNHHYKLTITAINGPGAPDPDGALNSLPGNVAMDLSVWEGGNNVGGVWNGIYEIKFTSLEANFTQFGEPSPQVVTITTNCPELTFDNFTNVSSGSGDGMWSENPAGIWSNGHFTVVALQGTPGPDGKTDYTLMISSKETQNGDVDARESRFKIKGSNMEANFKITQDRHLDYRLITSPSHITPIVVDGTEQRLMINVSSTHNYSVTFNSLGTTIFPEEIYENPNDVIPISDINDINKDITTIYVQLNANGTTNPRMGTLTISHTDPLSEAPFITYNVLQVTPVIVATLTDGGYTGNVPEAGGAVTINVVSNASEWVPVLKRRIGSNPEEDLSDFYNLISYFGIANGSGSSDVTFTAPALIGEEDIVYTIRFMDTNTSEVSNPPIVLTQKYAVPGAGSGGVPPVGGVRAEEFILSVDAQGILNLDGPNRNKNWLVYFKWGSTIALSSKNGESPFNKDMIAWTPVGYDYDALVTNLGLSMDGMAYNKIPYASADIFNGAYSEVFPHDNTPEQLAAGLGDPCKLAVKDGVAGGFRMPTGNPYEQFTQQGQSVTYNGSRGLWSSFGGSNSQFYPYAGYLNSASGRIEDVGKLAYFWSSTPQSYMGLFNHSYSLSILGHSTGVAQPNNFSNRMMGINIRCVRDE